MLLQKTLKLSTEQFNKEWTAKQPELIEQVNTLTTNQFNIEKSVFNDELSALDVRMDNFDLKLNALNNYITPEMFGAKGDGATDDTNAIQQCIDNAIETKKDIFLQNTDNVYNITYDSEILTEQEVIDMVEAELSRFKPLAQTKPITKEEYMAVVETPKNIKVKMENDKYFLFSPFNFPLSTSTSCSGIVFSKSKSSGR